MQAINHSLRDDDLFPHLQDVAPEETPDVTISPRQALLAVESLSPRRTTTNPTASGSANKSHVVSGHESMAYNVMGHPSLGQADAGGSFRSTAHFSILSALGTRSFQTPSRSGIEGSAFMKPFKSPLVNTSAAKDSGDSQHASSFLNTVASTPIRGSNSVALDPSFSQVSSRSRFSTPVPMRGTPMRKAPAKKFVTPFKLGMRLGEPGHRQLKACYDAERVNTPSGLSTEDASSISDGSRKPTRRRFFVCQDGCVLDGTPDVTRSSCVGQKDIGFVWISAWNTWPRCTRKQGNVDLLLLIYLLVTTI
jgi:hypothetical protein